MNRENKTQQTPAYRVKMIADNFVITGKGDHPAWKSAHDLTEFSFPWETISPYPTKFKALHSPEWLYCLFDITDPDINLFQETDDKWEVASSSRAEIFFKIDDALSPYYCLEIDPAGRILDYKGKYHRNFERDWSWPEGHIQVKTHIGGKGYVIETALSKKSLRDLELLKGQVLQAGLYRADCSLKDKTNPAFKWVSWVTPDSPTPEFHIPSSFGILQLE